MISNVIAIYDSEYVSLFEDIHYVKASVSDTSQVFSHPLEDGSVLSDYKIENQIAINLQVMLVGADYRNSYKKLKKIKTDGTAITIQTKTDVYANMIINSFPPKRSIKILIIL